MTKLLIRYIAVIFFTLVWCNSALAQRNKVEADSIAPDGTPIYKYMEQMPQAPYNLNAYLATQIKYPAYAQANNIEGKVLVRFVVTKKGLIDSVSVLQSVGGGCDEEAVRVVRSMPKWIPGKMKRATARKWKKVHVYYTLPISFKLAD